MVPDCKVSIIVVGESGVGKTSLLLRYTSNTFKAVLPLTMIDCFHKVIKLMDKEIKLDLWDTAGQDRFRAITKQYYRMADGVLLVYDVTNVVSFHKLSSWLDELRATNVQAKIIIVGNKNDDPNRKSVSVSQIKSYAEQEGIEFVETSAKTGKDLNIIFDFLVTKILQAKGIVPMSSSSSQQLFSSERRSASAQVSASASDAEGSDTSAVQSKPIETSCIGEPTTSEAPTAPRNDEKRETITETSLNNHDINSLPPIIPAPDGCIKLHVEMKKKNKKSKCGCA